MTTNSSLLGAATMVVGCILMSGGGCAGESSAARDLCCPEFSVGRDLAGVDFGVDATIRSSFEALAQGASDFSVAARAMLDDVTGACRRLAEDLGADEAARAGADATVESEARARAWCKLAAERLKASGALDGALTFDKPVAACSVAIADKARCVERCAPSSTCDLGKSPPTCSGGALVGACIGVCSVHASTLRCESGVLSGVCVTDESCDAACSLFAQATGSCAAKPFSITPKSGSDPTIEAVVTSLQENLPKLLVSAKARGATLGPMADRFAGKGTVDLVKEPGKLGVKGAACGLAVATSLDRAARHTKAAIEAGALVLGPLGL